MYPFAIINNFGSKIERVYRQFAARVNKKIFPALLPNPTLDGIVEYSELAPSLKGKGTSVYQIGKVTPALLGKGSTLFRSDKFFQSELGLRLDAANVLELLEEIRSTYGNYVDQDTLNKIISENLNLLDGWSTSQVNRMIESMNDKISPSPSLQRGENGVDKPVVPLIPKKNLVTMANIPRANNTQRLLQNEAYSRYFHDVEEIINDGIIDRLSTDEITKRILDKVDMNAKRARFWAEDQAAIFQAEQTRIKAEQSGQTHYRWKCQGNARPSHAVHNNQIVSWKVGVNNLSRPGARHAGEDYRCHCVPEFVTPEKIAKSGVGSPSGRAPQSTKELVANYEGKTVIKSEPRDSRPITPFELLTQEGIRLAVVEQNLPPKNSSVLIAQSPLEIGVVYNSAGDLINAINGNRNAITGLEEFASDLINGTFLHNHPSATSFSLEDIVFFEQSKVKTMIVATKDYRYILERGNKIIDAKKLMKEFRKVYQEAYENSIELVKKGMIDNKDLAKEIVNIQWKMASDKLGIRYKREAL